MHRLPTNRDRYGDPYKKEKEINHNIIAVGYKLNIEPIFEKLNEILTKLKIDVSKYDFDKIVYAGVKYDNKCYGNLKEACDTQPNMLAWYSTRKGKVYDVSCDTLYIQPKLIIGKMIVASTCFYIFLSNMTNDQTTTVYKKRINNGEYLPTQIEKIIIHNVEPYIYKK